MAEAPEFSVSDVYQHAAMIGQDIEAIVNEYGKESIEEIMPKIVYVLEQLEGLAEKRKLDQERIEELLIEKESLVIHTKRDEAIKRQLEEKLSYMEQLVSEDKDGLRNKVRALQQQSECFLDELEQRDGELVKLKTQGALPGDVEVMMRMKSTIDEQRAQIRQLNSELQVKRRDIDALQENSDCMTDLNENLRRNVFILQSKLKQYQSSSSLSETDGPGSEVDINSNPSREVITCNLTDIEEETNKGDISLQDELLSCSHDIDDTKSLPSISTDLSELDIRSTDQSELDIQSTDQSELDIQSIDQSEIGKLEEARSFDRPGQRSIKDPNRPRYTLKEMQNVLEEKNLYKIQKLALEEELDLYKSASISKQRRSSQVVTRRDSVKSTKSGGVRSLLSKFIGK